MLYGGRALDLVLRHGGCKIKRERSKIETLHSS